MSELLGVKVGDAHFLDLADFANYGEYRKFASFWGTPAQIFVGLADCRLSHSVAEGMLLPLRENDRRRLIRSCGKRGPKRGNRKLLIFPPFSTPQGEKRGANQNDPLTAISSQAPVECVGILGGQAPTLFREYSPPNIQKKLFVGFRTTFNSFRMRSAISVCSTELKLRMLYGIG
jgi:hypothetical protein